jgi:hypothetical protein
MMGIGIALTAGSRAEAQGGGLRLVPSFTAVAVHDDNIFLTSSDRQTGLFGRLSPAVRATYSPKARLMLQGRYSLVSEIFPDHPDLSRAVAAQRATLDLQYKPTPRTLIAMSGRFEDTQEASELIEEIGLEFGRRAGRTHAAGARLDRRVTQGGTLGMDYSFQAFRLDQVGTSTIHGAGAGWDQRLRAGTNVTLDYRFEAFESALEPPSRSHAVRAGCVQRIGKRTSLSFQAGGRLTDGQPGAEGEARLTRELRRGALSLAYARERNLALFREFDTESLVTSVKYLFGRRLLVTASPGVYRNRYPTATITSYRANVTANRQLGRFLSVHAGYQLLIQDGRPDLGAASARVEQVSKNLVVVGITLADRRHRVN